MHKSYLLTTKRDTKKSKLKYKKEIVAFVILETIFRSNK